MKKKLFILLSLLIIIPNCFSQIYNKSHKMFITKTEHFDIIFPEESTETAKLIAENCENYYNEICDKLFAVPYFRIPVAITPDTDSLNAYYTMEPYHRIVIYDTVVQSGSLTNFRQTILSVFYHELTHAISLGIRTKGWEKASKIFGDFLSPGQIFYFTPFFIEGVTVSFESSFNEGRVNDAYSMHYVKQAKVENNFPDWRNVTGVRDVHPGGKLPYIFGGSFSFYIQKKYGMEKYAEFFHECAKFNFDMMEIKFNLIYGTSLDELWKEFENEIQIPVTVNDCSTVSENYFVEKKYGKIFDSIASSKNGIAFLSNTNKKVYLKTNDGKIKFLFTTDTSTPQRITFSSNGNFITHSYALFDEGSKNMVRVYDLKKKHFVKTFSNLRDATVVNYNNINYVAAVKTNSQISTLVVHDFNKKIIFEKVFDFGIVPFNIVDCGNNIIAYLEKNKLDWSLNFIDLKNNKEFNLSLDCKPFDLQCQNGILSFSFHYDENVHEPTLARCAIVKPDFAENEIKLKIDFQNEDFSGGVFSPVLQFDDFGISNIVFVSKFYDKDKLLFLNKSKINFTTEEKRLVREIDFYEMKSAIGNYIFEKSVEDDNDFEKQKYNPLKNLHKGIILPLPALSMFETYHLSDVVSFSLFYYTKDPANLFAFQSEIRYSPLENTVGGGLSFTNYFGDWVLTTILRGSYFLNTNNRFYALGTFNLQKTFPILYSNCKVILNNNAKWFSANYNLISNQFDILSNIKAHIFQNVFSLSFQNLKYKYSGAYSISGFSFNAQCVTKMNFDFDNFNIFKYDLDFYPIFALQISLPRLLPFSNPDNCTINFPVQIITSLFNVTKTEGDYKDIFIKNKAKVVLFSHELQKTFRKSSWYLNRITFNLCCTNEIVPNDGVINYNQPFIYFSEIDKMEFRYKLTLETKLISTLILGSLTGQLFNLGVDFHYDLTKNKFSASWGLFTEL